MIPVAGQLAFRAVVKEEHLVGHDVNGPIVTRQSRLLWVVPTLGSERLLVLYACPRENPLIATADNIVSTLSLSTPVVARVPVKRSRDQVLHKWLYDTSGASIPGRRAESKLMTDAQLSRALPGIFSDLGLDWGNRSLRIDEDPGKLLWVVAVSGGDLGQEGGDLRRLGTRGFCLQCRRPARTCRSIRRFLAQTATGRQCSTTSRIFAARAQVELLQAEARLLSNGLRAPRLAAPSSGARAGSSPGAHARRARPKWWGRSRRSGSSQ